MVLNRAVNSGGETSPESRGTADSLLASLRLFEQVDTKVLQPLLNECPRLDVDTGQIVISPDKSNVALHIVLSGSLHVYVGDLNSQPVAELISGDCAGEMSIIEGRAPSAFVVAAEPAHLLVLPRPIVWSLVDASHAFSKNLLVVLSERVRHHNNVIANQIDEMSRHHHNATTDALTRLNNRHWMADMFPREIQRCLKSNDVASMIMIDVDGFKLFNDRFGHVAGDRVLSMVAKALKEHFRPRDLIARYGGDEFAVLLPGCGRHDAVATAERVRSAISGDTASCDDSLVRSPVTISVGVGELEPEDTLEKLLRKADAALYRAKHNGRNQVSC